MAEKTPSHDFIAAGDGFSLGQPALVCRWRLAGASLPLANRHLRALRARADKLACVTPQLVSWAKQHIEWTLRDGAQTNPDGVLMLLVDEAGQAAMTVGPYTSFRTHTARNLADRTICAQEEAQNTGVAPEVLWAVDEHATTGSKRLICCLPAHQASSAVTSLIEDLAKTLGIAFMRNDSLARELFEPDTERFTEYFLTSDEHGVVVASDYSQTLSIKLKQSYQELLDKAR